MKRLYRQEIIRALSNRWTLISIAIMSILCIANVGQSLYSASHVVKAPIDYMQAFGGNPFAHSMTVYGWWIGAASGTLPFLLLTFLWPFLSTMPYSWALVDEIRNGYADVIIVSCGRWNYIFSKLLAAFLAGGIVVALPQLLDFLVLCLFFPSGIPDITAQMYYGIAANCLWAEVFYSHPYMYVLLYILLDFVFCGLFAVMGCACGLLGGYGYCGTVFPFLVLLMIHYARKLLAYKVYIEISPLNYLHARPIENPVNWWVILIEGSLFFIISFMIIWRKGVKEELPARS